MFSMLSPIDRSEKKQGRGNLQALNLEKCFNCQNNKFFFRMKQMLKYWFSVFFIYFLYIFVRRLILFMLLKCKNLFLGILVSRRFFLRDGECPTVFYGSSLGFKPSYRNKSLFPSDQRIRPCKADSLLCIYFPILRP